MTDLTTPQRMANRLRLLYHDKNKFIQVFNEMLNHKPLMVNNNEEIIQAVIDSPFADPLIPDLPTWFLRYISQFQDGLLWLDALADNPKILKYYMGKSEEVE